MTIEEALKELDNLKLMNREQNEALDMAVAALDQLARYKSFLRSLSLRIKVQERTSWDSEAQRTYGEAASYELIRFDYSRFMQKRKDV